MSASEHSHLRLAIAAGTTLVSLATVYSLFYSSNNKNNQPVDPIAIPSPLTTLLPSLSSSVSSALPYPPNLIPGARDVPTPYGSMRVYEWGPESGRKVLLIHGDTTPAPILLPTADALVKEGGCRVMLFDLWGRGYTCSPSPDRHPHDSNLYTQQILYALTSSPLSWTGSSSGAGFSLVGFSLGCSIAISFAILFPQHLQSMVLLGPAGLIRSIPATYENRILQYPSLVSSSYMKKVIGGIVEADTSLSTPESFLASLTKRHEDKPLPLTQESQIEWSDRLDIAGVVQQQYSTHQGFPFSFRSTILYGPLQDRQRDWRELFHILLSTPPSSNTDKPSPSADTTNEKSPGKGLHGGKVLVIFAESDTIVRGAEVREDIRDLFRTVTPANNTTGPSTAHVSSSSSNRANDTRGGSEIWREHIEFANVPGTHGFPVPYWRETVDHIMRFWDL